jgi:ergothioneine biosynthesis protein EgtB
LLKTRHERHRPVQASVHPINFIERGGQPMSTTAIPGQQVDLAVRFQKVRQRTLALCDPLSAEDMMVQSCPEASPAKWHVAHTAWFFESFILREFLPGYRLFNQDFPWLFNSYYQGFAAFPEKRLRASFSRPGLEEILNYRAHVDEAIEKLLGQSADAEALRRIELGLHHEEQHQELLLTDTLNAFFSNPLRPAYLERDPESAATNSIDARAGSRPLSFIEFPGGLHFAGHDGQEFCFDNELSRHKIWLEPYALGDRLVTCEEFAAFMADGGYQRAELWLSAGWDTVKANGWRAPLYWTDREGDWRVFTLRGEMPVEQVADAPVSHVSYYEADAYARWAGCRLPTEFEWEAAVEGAPIEGNLLDSGALRPIPARAEGGAQFFGDCWQWTASAYLAYPGFRPLEGALGEYNGKFMCGQMVLRGGSCATPAQHIRASYRNFFQPETRWQFSGIRLAR